MAEGQHTVLQPFGRFEPASYCRQSIVLKSLRASRCDKLTVPGLDNRPRQSPPEPEFNLMMPHLNKPTLFQLKHKACHPHDKMRWHKRNLPGTDHAAR